jgi:exodeoxyribonuclease V beta subunit
MRSWSSQTQPASDLSESSQQGEDNSMQEAANSWISGLGGRADYQMFTNEDADFNGEIDITQDTGTVNLLEEETWNADCNIPNAKIVESFSGLTRQVGFDGRDLDGLSDGEDQQEDFMGEEKTPIFKFPAGANAGNFMHDVFEHLDFSDSSNWETFIGDTLKRHQYDSKKWTGIILGMVEQVLCTELQPGFSLQNLEKTDRLEEMEFHFPMAPGFLPELADSLPEGTILKKYLTRLNREDCRRIEGDGYLKGLIDLTFRANGKYYVLDWKSNKLGGRKEGFGDNEIEREMLTHHYVLQYHLYVVALHRFLLSRMKDYSYERNFGGVYYLFVRGMSEGSKNGIYFDLPDFNTVQALEDFLVSKK